MLPNISIAQDSLTHPLQCLNENLSSQVLQKHSTELCLLFDWARQIGSQKIDGAVQSVFVDNDESCLNDIIDLKNIVIEETESAYTCEATSCIQFQVMKGDSYEPSGYQVECFSAEFYSIELSGYSIAEQSCLTALIGQLSLWGGFTPEWECENLMAYVDIEETYRYWIKQYGSRYWEGLLKEYTSLEELLEDEENYFLHNLIEGQPSLEEAVTMVRKHIVCQRLNIRRSKILQRLELQGDVYLNGEVPQPFEKDTVLYPLIQKCLLFIQPDKETLFSQFQYDGPDICESRIIDAQLGMMDQFCESMDNTFNAGEMFTRRIETTVNTHKLLQAFNECNTLLADLLNAISYSDTKNPQ
jgi:hypothetical protein